MLNDKRVVTMDHSPIYLLDGWETQMVAPWPAPHSPLDSSENLLKRHRITELHTAHLAFFLMKLHIAAFRGAHRCPAPEQGSSLGGPNDTRSRGKIMDTWKTCVVYTSFVFRSKMTVGFETTQDHCCFGRYWMGAELSS